MAERMLLRAQQKIEETRGPKHQYTLLAVNNLGNLYTHQGKLDDAEKLLIRALEGYEEVLDSQAFARYRPTLNTMSALGDVFKAQGNVTKAKTMYTRAFYGFEALPGPFSRECQHITHALASLEET